MENAPELRDLSRDDIVVWFQENFPEMYKKMESSNHNLNENTRSPFHSEGSVWTHTMMVMTFAYWNCPANLDRISILFAGLLHDLGKPDAREVQEESSKVRFKGHEGISSMLSLEVLEKALKDGIISQKQRFLIFNIISLHGTNTEDYKDKELSDYLRFFRECDKMGAVRNVDENIYSQYDKRKFSKNADISNDRKCTILVGLPGSGKSTFVREKFSNVDDNIFILSRDAMMMGFGLRKTNTIMTYNETYEYVHKDEKILKEFNDLFEEQIRFASKVDNVVVDMTMMSLKSRRTMMNKLGKRDYRAIVMLPTIQEIKSRTRKGKTISDNVYHFMMKQFVVPVFEEGFSQIDYIFNNNNSPKFL